MAALARDAEGVTAETYVTRHNEKRTLLARLCIKPQTYSDGILTTLTLQEVQSGYGGVWGCNDGAAYLSCGSGASADCQCEDLALTTAVVFNISVTISPLFTGHVTNVGKNETFHVKRSLTDHS